MSLETNPMDACRDGLRDYLACKVPGLTVYTDWPNANDKLVYPTLTLTVDQAKVMNLPPEIVSKTLPDAKNQICATEIIGEVDFQIQCDLWAASKPERSKFLGLIMDAINAQAVDMSGLDNPPGLSLALVNYFNEWARFDVDSFQNVDDEAAAQRRERRAKIMLLVNSRVIRQRIYYAIKHLEVHDQATTDPLVNDDSDTEVITVF